MRYKRNDSFLLREIAGDYVLTARGEKAIDFSAVIIFNDTGVILWKNLNDYKSPEQLAQLLISEYDAPSDTVLKDVNEFIRKMEEDGLILTEDG